MLIDTNLEGGLKSVRNNGREIDPDQVAERLIHDEGKIDRVAFTDDVEVKPHPYLVLCEDNAPVSAFEVVIPQGAGDQIRAQAVLDITLFKYTRKFGFVHATGQDPTSEVDTALTQLSKESTTFPSGTGTLRAVFVLGEVAEGQQDARAVQLRSFVETPASAKSAALDGVVADNSPSADNEFTWTHVHLLALLELTSGGSADCYVEGVTDDFDV